MSNDIKDEDKKEEDKKEDFSVKVYDELQNKIRNLINSNQNYKEEQKIDSNEKWKLDKILQSGSFNRKTPIMDVNQPFI